MTELWFRHNKTYQPATDDLTERFHARQLLNEAAPDMYEALLALKMSQTPEAWAKADAALRKARGEPEASQHDRLHLFPVAKEGRGLMTVKPIFAWYDLWIGAFWDQHKRRLYLFPVPMLGIVVQFPPPRNPRQR